MGVYLPISVEVQKPLTIEHEVITIICEHFPGGFSRSATQDALLRGKVKLLKHYRLANMDVAHTAPVLTSPPPFE